jgi:transcriptional regulator with XRE-family HTH domain
MYRLDHAYTSCVPSLETLRRAQPLTQQELASRAGVAVSTIHTLEAGRNRRVRPRTMRAIADALGVRPDQIDEFRASLGPQAEA